MSKKKLSVRKARMELDFATLEGKTARIRVAQKQLEEAIAEAQKKKSLGDREKNGKE